MGILFWGGWGSSTLRSLFIGRGVSSGHNVVIVLRHIKYARDGVIVPNWTKLHQRRRIIQNVDQMLDSRVFILFINAIRQWMVYHRDSRSPDGWEI
jgi:hypothetical protein